MPRKLDVAVAPLAVVGASVADAGAARITLDQLLELGFAPGQYFHSRGLSNCPKEGLGLWGGMNWEPCWFCYQYYYLYRGLMPLEY